MQLILGDDRLHRWDLGHLLPLGLRILPLQGVLAVATALRLDGDHHVHLLHRHQRPGVPLMTRLSTRSTSTRLSTRLACQGPGGDRSTAAATSSGSSAALARSSAGPSPPSAAQYSPTLPLGFRADKYFSPRPRERLPMKMRSAVYAVILMICPASSHVAHATDTFDPAYRETTFLLEDASLHVRVRQLKMVRLTEPS